MTNTDQLVTVLEVACLTEDRSPGEQRALLALALRLDSDRGAWMAHNPDLAPPTLVAHVEATYDPSSGKPVSLTAAQREKYNRLCARWSRCRACSLPMGMHYADDVCPRADDYFLLHRAAVLDAWRAVGHPVALA